MTDLPEGMEPAESASVTYYGGWSGDPLKTIHEFKQYIADRDSQWRKALDEARSEAKAEGANEERSLHWFPLSQEFGRASERIAELERERDEARYDERVTADLASGHIDEARTALAASQAECAKLREALYGFTRWMSPEGSRIEAFVDCAHEMREARNLLSRPTGTQDALRAVLLAAISDAGRHAAKIATSYENAALAGEKIEPWDTASAAILNDLCDPDDPDVLRIVARVLGEVAK